MALKQHLVNLTKHELCMAIAGWAAAPGSEDFNNEYESYHEDWLAGYTFVKMLGPNEALYLLGINDDEGPNPYEGVCAAFAHITKVEGELKFRWAEWNC